MTYKFNKETHSTKVKAGMKAAKQAGKKLGRPKGEKIKGEELVLKIYRGDIKGYVDHSKQEEIKPTYKHISILVGVSKSTVQRIINKYKKRNGN